MNLLKLINDVLGDDYSTPVTKTVKTELDLTKREDVEKLKETVKEFKDSTNPFIRGLHSIFGTTFDETLDEIVEYAENKCAEAEAEVIEAEKSSRPSSKTSEEMKQKIAKLVQEYMKDKIIPAKQLNEEQLKSVTDGLFEFACWIYNK